MALVVAALWAWPQVSAAAPPEPAKGDAPGGDLPWAEASLQVDDPLAKRDPNSPLNFLSEEEYRRVARTEPITVPTQVVLSSDFPTRLANACNDIDALHSDAWGVSEPMDLSRVLSGQLGSRALFQHLQNLSPASTQDEVVGAARELATVGTEIGQICDRLAGLDGGLTASDVAVLRAAFADDGVVLTQLVEVLSKSSEELLELLTADERGYEEARDTFIEAVDIGRPGTPQSIGALSSLGSAGSKVFDGLAQFVIDRAREEAIAYVREQLTETVCGSDIGVFIPTTCDALETVDGGLSLSAMGATLNAALITDLEVIPDRLLVLAGERAPEAAYASTMVRVLLGLARDAREHGDPLAYIVSLHARQEIDCEMGNPAAGTGDAACADTMALLRLSSALSYAIVSQNSQDNDYFKSLGVAFAIEERVASLPPSSRARLEALVPELNWTEDGELRMNPAQLALIHRVIVDSVVIIETLQERIDELGSFDGKDPTAQDILATAAIAAVGLANIGIDLLELVELGRLQRTAADQAQPMARFETRDETSDEIGDSARGLGGVLASPTGTTGTGTTGMPSVGALALAAPSEGAELAQLADLAMLRALLEHASDMFSLAKDLSERDWSQSVPSALGTVVDLLDTYGDNARDKARALEEDFDTLRRYLPILIEVANAKSSEEVSAVLQAAFPAGGYKLKYRQRTVAINMMLGAYGGALYGSALNADGTTTQGLSNGEFAMFAPVGVHITGPVGLQRKRPWHLGLLVSVLDIGGITTSKWVLDGSTSTSTTVDTTDTQETTLGEPNNFNYAGVISPGGYFTVGAAKSPFVFGLGASYSPFAQQLNAVTTDTNGDETASDSSYLGTLRFGAFVAVDITLISFAMRGKSKD